MTNLEEIESMNRIFLKKVVESYGLHNQLSMVTEECAELITAINHFKRGRLNYHDVITEMADVQVVLDQMKVVFGLSEFDEMYAIKINKLKEKLNK